MKRILMIGSLAVLVALQSCETSHSMVESETAKHFAEGSKSPQAKPGFAVFEEDGRLWVFSKGDVSIREYKKSRELAKCVTSIGAGPNGETVKAPEQKTIDGFRLAHGVK